MRTSTYGRWWLHERYVADSDDGVTHDSESCDHRHFAAELDLGWRFWTPAGRFETVERMEATDASQWVWRIWTTETGPDWSWRRRADERVDAVRPNPTYGPHLRLVELSRSQSSHGSMHIVPCQGLEPIPDFQLTLAEAHYLGAGQGWKLTDRPDGGAQISALYTTQAKARSGLLAAARHHAKILNLKVYKESELAQHF